MVHHFAGFGLVALGGSGWSGFHTHSVWRRQCCRWCRGESVDSGREGGSCLLVIALWFHADATSQWPKDV